MTVLLVVVLAVAAFLFITNVLFIATSMWLCHKFHVFKLRGNGYRGFSPTRYLWGVIRHPLMIPQLLWRAAKADGYMSVRIAPNEKMGWTVSDNVALSYQRAGQLQKAGAGIVLNPVYPNDVVGRIWSPAELVTLWPATIVFMAILGKKFYYFPEDSQSGGSQGCRKEMIIAQHMHMICSPATYMINRDLIGGEA